MFDPILASGALQFAFEKATLEGKITISVLILVSLFSWTVMITKARQLFIAGRQTRRFFAAFRETRDPAELSRLGKTFDGAPAYEVYTAAVEELQFQLREQPVMVNGERMISRAGLESVKVTMERVVSEEALGLEKGMIILSTAVAGGPFIGLLGTVWGVMETFAGVARAASASLTAMAPGVAGALIATVVGLLVAIPAMFAYNYMVTLIRAHTQRLDAFAAEFVTSIEHKYVDNRALADHLGDILRQRGIETQEFARA
jgi:biopolymer transport protein ExbB/TolQ